jgi:aminoglycoside phosphotransferase (APT) family kinase protein
MRSGSAVGFPPEALPISAPSGAPIGVGKEAEVFATPRGVLKLYRRAATKAAAFREAATLAVVEASGLPAPAVLSVGRYGDRWGIEMTRAEGPSFGAAMVAEPALIPRYLDAMASLQNRIHGVPGAGLPALKTRMAEAIARAPGLPPPLRGHLLRELAALPDGDRLCHGDFHPLNILGPPSAAMVVDWLDASAGIPDADLCRSWLLMHLAAPEIADGYLVACERVAGITRRDALAGLPVVAGARLAEGADEEAPALLAMAAARIS